MLSPSDVRLLDRLTLTAFPAAVAAAAGARRTRVRGAGLEFHEFRPYQPGDDPRTIDWTVEARLGHLVVRSTRAEGQGRIHVLLDTSASMGIGTPPKLALATRLAAAIAYLAVKQREPVALTRFTDHVADRLGPAEGRHHLFRVLSTLEATHAGGPSGLDRALQAYGAASHGPGLTIVLSDFFPDTAQDGLRFLMHRGLTPVALQVLEPAELDPSIGAVTELLDVEDPASRSVVVDPEAVAAYRARLGDELRRFRSFCQSNGILYRQITSTQSMPDLLATLRHAGLFTYAAA